MVPSQPDSRITWCSSRLLVQIGGTQHLDLEPFKHSSWAKVGRSKAGVDLFVNSLCSLASQLNYDPEHVMEFLGQPHARWCAAKQVKIIGEELPDFLVIS